MPIAELKSKDAYLPALQHTAPKTKVTYAVSSNVSFVQNTQYFISPPAVLVLILPSLLSTCSFLLPYRAY